MFVVIIVMTAFLQRSKDLYICTDHYHSSLSACSFTCLFICVVVAAMHVTQK